MALLPSQVRSFAITASGLTFSPAAINYPAVIVAGDLLVCVVGIDTAQTISSTDFDIVAQVSSADSSAVLTRTAVGDETGTFEVAYTTDDRRVSAMVYAIKNPTAAAEAASATGTSANPDAPSLSPSGGLGAYQWITAYVNDGTEIMRAWPAGVGVWHGNINTGQSVNLSSATYVDVLASLDPAAALLNGSQEWIAWTVAVPVDASEESPNPNWPQVESEARSTWGTAATTQALSLPTGIVAGDLLIAEIGTRTVATPTITGWTTLTGPTSTGGLETGTIMVKTAVGDESGTVTVSWGASSVQGHGTCRRISGADVARVYGVSVGLAASTTLDFPVLTPVGEDPENVLWIAGFTSDTTVGEPVRWPDGRFSMSNIFLHAS